MEVNFHHNSEASILYRIVDSNKNVQPTEVSETAFIEKFQVLKKMECEIPATLRFDLFKSILKSHPDSPELLPSKLVRELFDCDLEYMKRSLATWKTKREQAQKALQNIETFMSSQRLSVEMSFKEHSYLCFCLSALMSGKEIEELDKEYTAQLHTMVKGVVHPLGEWTVKNVLEDQSYAKFIFHVSQTGLAEVSLLNEMTSFRLDPSSPFCGLRLVAVACGEVVGFDGIEDCGSLKVLLHDFIHAGFMKYQYETHPDQYWEDLKKVGMIWEHICSDQKLAQDRELRALVDAAFFMWTHELTTSIFVDGWPRGVPGQKWFLGGQYASGPQVLLRLAAKFHIIPPLFAKEIENEEGLLQIQNEDERDHYRIKRIMDRLDLGYAYLAENFGEFYGRRSFLSVMWNRLTDKISHKLL